MSTLKNALAAKGIKFSEVETTKNGVICTGYRLDNGTNICPVIYYSPDETVESFVERACEISHQPTPDINAEEMISRENLLSKSYLCIQKPSEESIVKKDFLNLELYIRLGVEFGDDETKGSIKVTMDLLKRAELSEDELWESARKNSINKASIFSMAEALGLPEEIVGDVAFYVATYTDRVHGAGVLALEEILHRFCVEKDVSRIYILPSSTEEVLLLPSESANPEELASLVMEVNRTSVVEPVLRLNPTCYLFDSETRKVSIASTIIGEEV